MGFLNIGITNRCNLKCKMCDSVGIHCLHSQDMNFETFKNVIDCMKQLRIFKCDTISFAGFGENLLNKECMLELEYAKKYFKNVLLTTNGILLTPKLSFALLKLGLSEIHISMTGADTKVYSQFQGYGLPQKNLHSLFMKVQQNVFQLCHIKEKYHFSSKIILRYIVTQESNNYRSILNYINLAKKLRVDQIYFYKLFEKSILPKKIKPCDDIGNTFSIDYQGNISPCCEDFESEVVFGNIFEHKDKILKNYTKLFTNNKKCNFTALPLRCQECRHTTQAYLFQRLHDHT